MKTATLENVPVYGPRPALEQVASRAKRERFDAATLRSAIVRYPRYWVECWARPGSSLRQMVRDESGQVVEREVTGWYVYTLRRDGRVQWDGHSTPESKIVFGE